MAADNTKHHKHSKFLFFNQENAEPIVFYMRPCADRGLLRSLIEHGGGTMTVKCTQNSVKLAMKTDQVSTDDYLLSSYITDCVRENKLLDTKDYKMKPKKISVASSKDLSMNTSITEDIDDMSPADVIQRNTGTKGCATAGRMNYSLQDDMEIIKYAVENCDNKPVKGMALFKDMAIMKVTAHSADSMNTRFRKNIIYHIDSYDIPDTWKFKLTQNSKYLKSPSPSKAKGPVKTPEITCRIQPISCSSSEDMWDKDLLTSSPSKAKGHIETPEITCESQPISCSSSEDMWDKDLLSNALTRESPPNVSSVNINKDASSSPQKSAVIQDSESVNGSSLHSSPFKTGPKDDTKRTPAHTKARNIFDDVVNREDSLKSYSPKDKEKNTVSLKVSEKSPTKSCTVVLVNCTDEKTEATESHGNSATKLQKSPRKSKRLQLKNEHHEQEIESTDDKANRNKKNNGSRAEKRKMGTSTPSEDRCKREELGSRKKKERLSYVQNLDNFKEDCCRSPFQRGTRVQQNKERLCFVQDLDNLEHCSQTESQNGEATQSEKDAAESEDDEEIEKNCKIVKKMAAKYSLTLREIFHVLYMNDGSISEAERWIVTGRTSKGQQPWDLQSDKLLEDGSLESMTTLYKRYGNTRVKERISFLETG